MNNKQCITIAVRALAKAILASAKAHEDSFFLPDLADSDDSLNSSSVGFYRLSIPDACIQESPEELAFVVEKMLRHSWNEALDWAVAVDSADAPTAA